MDIDLKSQVEPIVRLAGDLLLNYFPRSKDLARKDKDGAGFVTEADLASEKLLIEKLSEVVPEAAFCAEESGNSGDGNYCWVIDPLDGTTNFAHGIPHFCISVALTYKKNPIFGMIYDPVLNELFWGQLGKGAWLNDTRLSIAPTDRLSESFLVVGFPYKGIDGYYESFMKQVAAVAPKAYAFRKLGAAALDLAYTACGRFDGIFCSRMQWWDLAAGAVLVKESGGLMTDFEGALIGPESESVVAGGSSVHQTLLKLLAK